MSKKKIDLSPELKKPLDPSNLANDEGTLRILAGALNAGARVPKGLQQDVDPAKYSGPTGEGNTTITLDSMPTAQEQAAQAAASRLQTAVTQPRPTVQQLDAAAAKDFEAQLAAAAKPLPAPKSRRLVFTGRNLSALAQQLGATQFALDDAARAIAASFYPTESPDSSVYQGFLATVFAWGTGEISDKFPATAERALFCRAVREEKDWAQYGKNAGFWTDSLVATAKTFSELSPDALLVFTGIPDVTALHYFVALGFQHWHVTGPANLPVDPLSQRCDHDVIKALSKDRNGPKLRVIWSPETPNPSPRLWTQQEFLASFK